ncbi:hypothetical protein N7490_006257 [Penicillium lividum]|nr:hypothetical protein N7490_006257 [Penicillium lividum]
MRQVILPSSAAAFALRSSPIVVLGSQIPPWLTATLKEVNFVDGIKHPLNNVAQHTRFLIKSLSSEDAVWTLCSMMFTKAPEAELRKDENPLIEALFNYQTIHIEAYVVCIDMFSLNEMAFKLTQETIEDLVDYHKDIFLVDAAANTPAWSGKHADVEKLQKQFVQAANKFVYRANTETLKGLEKDGTGELLSDQSEAVKANILNLFMPLLPPQPRMAAVPTPITFWTHQSAQSANPHYLQVPMSAHGCDPSIWAGDQFWDAAPSGQLEWISDSTSLHFPQQPPRL